MAYFMAASMALNVWGAGQKAKAMAQEEAANIETQREMDRLAFNRQQQKFMQDSVNTKRQLTMDTFNINLAAAQAEDQLALHKAGTNLSGSSINDLDSEISRSVHADRMSSQRQFDETQTNLNQERTQANQNREISANLRKPADYTQIIRSAFLSSAANGLGQLK